MPIRINGVPLLDEDGKLRFQFREIRGAIRRAPNPAPPESFSHETSGQRFPEPGPGPSTTTTTDRAAHPGPGPGSLEV